MSNTAIKPILKYPGAKWRLADWIVSYFPTHTRYLEPYCGSAAVFFRKTPAEHEILNDLNSSIVNLFMVLREYGDELARRVELTPWSEEEYHLYELDYTSSPDPVENARRFVVRCWQAHGVRFREGRQGWKHNGLTGHKYPAKQWRNVPDRLLTVVDRLKDAEIRNKPALEVIAYYNTPDTLIYCDPPYMRSTRNDRYYNHEMSDDEHIALLNTLDTHKGAVIVSGYDHALYNQRLYHWYRVAIPTIAEHGRGRTEILWLNPKAAGMQQLRMFEREEEAV